MPRPVGAEADHVAAGPNHAHKPGFYVIQSCRRPVLQLSVEGDSFIADKR